MNINNKLFKNKRYLLWSLSSNDVKKPKFNIIPDYTQ